MDSWRERNGSLGTGVGKAERRNVTTKWRVDLDFGNSRTLTPGTVPTQSVRKMRGTYAADFQRGEFARGELRCRYRAGP
jgi:hypothetical protein